MPREHSQLPDGLLNFNGGTTVGDVGVYTGGKSTSLAARRKSRAFAPLAGARCWLAIPLQSVTIWVQGRDGFGDAKLNLSANATNSGTILLQSANNTYQSEINTGSSTLTNLGTITELGGRQRGSAGDQRHAQQPSHDRRHRRLPRHHRRVPGAGWHDQWFWLPGQLPAPGDGRAGVPVNHRGRGQRRHTGDRQPGRLHPLGAGQRPRRQRRPAARRQPRQPGHDSAAIGATTPTSRKSTPAPAR